MAEDPKAVERSKAAQQQPYTKERGAFKTLLLSNPNYFGNLVNSPFKPGVLIAGNTHYEELGCVGYHPQQRKLEGVVYIYQPSGYGTDICGPGTTEFVRFYLSYDNGATWEDEGLTSFQAYNIPQGTDGNARLEYAVSLSVVPRRKTCHADLLIRVRAILSWNNPPPAHQPGWNPIWGNIREATILIEPLRIIFPKEIFEFAKLKVPPQLKDIIDPETPIATPAKSLAVADLVKLYQDKGVPLHRFAFKELSAFASGQVANDAESFLSTLPGIKVDQSVIEGLLKTDGDTSYEELRCIGLDPNFPDTLVGVIQAKKAAGYSGGPCTNGSKEYVTFWADFDGNGSFETCLGTADVQVYDIPIGPQGVYYAVRLPVDFSEHRQPCAKGPKVVRIRAILSWNAPIACATPSKVPTWGNREETLITIAPSVAQPAGKIAILGGIPVSFINNNFGDLAHRGMTTPGALFATNNHGVAADSPFGATVSAQGAPIVGYSYIVEVSPDGSIWTPLLQDLYTTDSNGFVTKRTANPVTKRFDYLPFTDNVNGLMAEWPSSGDLLWYVRLSVYDPGGILQGTDTHLLQLDNTSPEVDIQITSGLGNCGKFTPGTTISGTFVARDLHFGSYSLGVEPAVNDPGEAVVVPSAGTVQTAVSPGDGWTLDTTGMRACGYIVRVVAGDRTIINSQSVGWPNAKSQGFCLLEPADE
jgi:hypothetical protein